MIDRQKIDERDIFFFSLNKKRNRIDIPLDVYVSFYFFYHQKIFFLDIKKMERERAVSITVPYIEQKSLSIDRKIFIKYPTLPFFLGIPHIQGSLPQAPHPIRLVGVGCSPFESNKISSRGGAATFILKETEETTFSGALLPSLRPHQFKRKPISFLVTGLRAPKAYQR
jgi:hypothetical protein